MLVISGCASTSSDQERTLVISTWGLNEDVLWQEDLRPFEELCGCKVVLETGTTAERFNKFSSNKDSQVDLIFLSQSFSARANKEGLVEKLDYNKIPNSKELIESASLLSEQGLAPAYAVNSIGIIYDEQALAKLGITINDWQDLWSPELANKIAIPDISTTFGPAMVNMANDLVGGNIAEDQGAAAFKKLEELKPNIVKTYSKSSDLANMFASGEVAVAVVGDFAVPVIQKSAEKTKYIVPESGTYLNFNTIDINPNSKNKDLAYEYINYRLSKEMQTRGALSAMGESPTNKNVELTPDQAQNLTYGDVASNGAVLDFNLINPLMENWIDQWNRLMNQ